MECSRRKIGGSLLQRIDPLFFFILFLYPVHLSAQSDTIHILRMDAGTDYFNVFSQSSDRSNSKIFSTMYFAGVSYQNGTDSLSVFFRSTKEYGALRQQNSLLSFSTTILERSIEAQFNSRRQFITYSLLLGYNDNGSAGNLLYGGGISISPWEKKFTVSASFKNIAFHYGTGILFRDFFVPFAHTIPVTETAAGFSLQPSDNLYGEVSYDRSSSTNGSPGSAYSVQHAYRADHIAAMIRFRPYATTHVDLFADRSFNTIEATLKQEAQSFGNFTDDRWRQNRIGIELVSDIMTFPVTFRYSFYEMSIDGSGSVESWPFTPLAASVIANRLYFNLSGSAKYHSAGIATGFTLLQSAVTVELEYDKVVPDLTLEHWEPEFLVFGMKNFTRDPFSIGTTHLGKIHGAISRSFSTVTTRLFIEQYFPLSIEYRKYEPIQTAPPFAPIESRKPFTDGGRKIGLRFSVNL
jgi:hypothetical protein